MLLDKKFKIEVDALEVYLQGIKKWCTEQEKILSLAEQNEFLKNQKIGIFKELDKYFTRLWTHFSDLPKNVYDFYRDYLEKKLIPLLDQSIETNHYIREKPLGYAGDYVTMNFIYEYYDGKYLGDTLYAKLINNYTCTIDVSRSNIYRKEYLKNKIRSYLEDGTAKILSIGCGPARELTELLSEEKHFGYFDYHLLDLEKNAIDFIKQKIKNLGINQNSKISFHRKDLIEIVKGKKIKNEFQDFDLIYISGVFDYLNDRLCEKVIGTMLDCLKPNGELIVFNMSDEKSKHRAYYEVFGGWKMYHRRKEDIARWVAGIEMIAESSIDNHLKCESYWILNLRKR